MPRQPASAGPPAGLPPGYLDRMSRLLGEGYPAFLASYDRPLTIGLRVNTLKISPEAFRALDPFDLERLPWPPCAFAVRDEARAGKHPYHAAGLYYLQDPSAMAAAALLDPQPGERVLDLAAAPGGKATHIAALMAGRGLVVANEVQPKRAWDLAGNLERWGATHAAITNETPERLAVRCAGFFDRVLVDAPCSGEGMFRKSEAARRAWSPELVSGCASRQGAILEHAAATVRPGGRLAYATCTFAPEENEGSVARFLRSHPEFELLAVEGPGGSAPGRPDWLPAGDQDPRLAHSVRFWPHLGSGEGHFVAVLRRNDAPPPQPPRQRSVRPAPLPRQAAEAYRAFCDANLAGAPGQVRWADDSPVLVLEGTYIYALPPAWLPARAGLRCLHPGWWLGTLRGRRFEPSHALALALRQEDAQRTLDLPAAGPDVLAYLRGESLAAAGEDGWVLVTVGGYALGWGKRAGGLVKSRYPRGLRRGGPLC